MAGEEPPREMVRKLFQEETDGSDVEMELEDQTPRLRITKMEGESEAKFPVEDSRTVTFQDDERRRGTEMSEVKALLAMLKEKEQHMAQLERQLEETLQRMQRTQGPTAPMAAAQATMMTSPLPTLPEMSPSSASTKHDGTTRTAPTTNDRSLMEEVQAQLEDAPPGEPMPVFNPRALIFEPLEIEGLLLDDRRAFRERQRSAACQRACDGKEVEKFQTSDAVRLRAFLEAVVRVLNLWEVQPGDWARVLLFYLDPDVLRTLRQQQPRPRSFMAIVQYLKRTYPVGGAVQNLRIVEFRATAQGDRSVRDYYEELAGYLGDGSGEFTEQEVTRQFVNHLRKGDLRRDVQHEYDKDVSHAKFLTMYQYALGVELRSQQEQHREAAQSYGVKKAGSWYGKPRDRATVAAAAHMEPAPGFSQRQPSWRSGCCFNCGSPKHRVAECTANCDNCKQAGHQVRTCQRICNKCGGSRHSFRFCRNTNLGEKDNTFKSGKKPDHGDDPPRRELPLMAYAILAVNTSTAATARPHRVLLTQMVFKGSTTPLVVGLDTMAATNVMSVQTARSLGVLDQKQPSLLQLQGVGKAFSAGVVCATLQVFQDAPWEDTTFETLTEELPSPVQMLLSYPWLECHQLDLQLRGNKNSVSLIPCASPQPK